MVTVKISDLRERLVKAAKIRGLSKEESNALADDYLDAELRGFKTHGVGKFFIINEAIAARRGKPRVIKESASSALIDGQRGLGTLVARYCISVLLQKAKKNGLAVVALRNVSRYGRLAPYGRLIAQSGFIGLITNSGGPAAVAPYGSYDPILGTNPICISFPRGDAEPIVIDFATSKEVWGEIRQAMLEGRDLPPETFFRNDGKYAVRPEDANAVQSFDGAKGYALCLAVEILCGSFVGAKMGLAAENEYDLGYVFLAMNSSMFRSNRKEFGSELDKLVSDIHNSKPIRPGEHVMLPGERSEALKLRRQKEGVTELDERVWEMLGRMSIDPKAGLETSNKTN